VTSGSMHDDCRATTIEYMCTKFGVDSSSHFPVLCFQFHNAVHMHWLVRWENIAAFDCILSR